MSIYHFAVKIISRAKGSSAVAAAAYRSASRLHDDRLALNYDYLNKPGVVHSEVMLPDGASPSFSNRALLWNTVEAGEKRNDAQLAREVEFALPREMNQAQGIDLARSFAADQFVSRGMIADLNVHWDIGEDGQAKPHAHVMLTLREVDGDAFGRKVREWNAAALVKQWREAWSDHVNQRLSELDIDEHVEHRSFDVQGIDLEPQGKRGAAAMRMAAQGRQSDRVDDHRAIAFRNGDRIIRDPSLALDALTHHHATITRRDIAVFAHRHSDDRDQYDRVLAAIHASRELVALGKDDKGNERFTTRDMIGAERSMFDSADRLARANGRAVDPATRQVVVEHAAAHGLALGDEQRTSLEHVGGASGLALVLGVAGGGKSAMLSVAKDAWETSGLRVRGLALSGIAAQNLEAGSGIASRTIASIEHGWRQGRDVPERGDVLVVDEAAMVGTRQLSRLIGRAEAAGAKLVLIGDPRQLQAIEAGAAFRALAERHGAIEINEVRRQQIGWQRLATQSLASGRTGDALHVYQQHGAVQEAPTREAARGALIIGWERDRLAEPGRSRIILSHTHEEVSALNDLARTTLRAGGELGDDIAIAATRGNRHFARGDRMLFLRNEHGLDVRNGTIATVSQIDSQRITARLDDGRTVSFLVKDYADIDHGYAVTIHKAQGATFDHVHVLATPGLDRHASYVALSRHRADVALHYGRDDFSNSTALIRLLSRERPKDNVADHSSHDAARAFAERREIGLAGQIREVGRKVQSIFASFRPREMLELLPAERPQETDRADEQRAVVRFALAWNDIEQLRRARLPSLPHLDEALDRAGRALNRVRPKASDDLSAAFRREPALARGAVQGRSAAVLHAMDDEMRVRTDPHARAERFIEGWRDLQRDRAELVRDADLPSARRIEQRMATMAKAMELDREVAAALLGLDVSRSERKEIERFAAPERRASEPEQSRELDR